MSLWSYDQFAVLQSAVHAIYIQSLPRQRKTIYYLNRVEGKTTREIAETLQLSHGYVRNALSAALAVIRERLAASGLQV